MEIKELDEITNKLSKLILLSQIKHAARADKDLKQLGLTGSEIKIIQYISMIKQMNVSKLSQALNISLSFTSNLVEKLTKDDKLIVKTQSTGDERENFLELTQKGKETLQKIMDYDTFRRRDILIQILNEKKLGENKLQVLSEIADILIPKFESEI